MIRNYLTALKRFWVKVHPKILPTLFRVRLTLVIFVTILIVGEVSESHGLEDWPVLVQHFGWDLTTLEHGQVYAAWRGLFFSSAPDDFYGILLLLLVTVGLLEYRRGTSLAAFAFFIIGPLASIFTLLALWPISNAGIEYVRVALYTPDLGSSTACLVCLGIFLVRETGKWHIIMIFGVLAVLLGLFYRNVVYNFDHLDGFLIGLGSGAIMAWWTRRKRMKQTQILQN